MEVTPQEQTVPLPRTENIHTKAQGSNTGKADIDGNNASQSQTIKSTPTMSRKETTLHAYGPRGVGPLAFLSVIGFAMSIALVVLTSIWEDGFGLVSVIFLSAISTLVGLGSHWTLVFPDYKILQNRDPKYVPRSDVVIYYPSGAFRIIRTSEHISRLYFQPEACKYTVADTPYRAFASIATVLLMAAVICLANAITKSQAAFVSSYLILNFLFWICSALSTDKHWQHPFTGRILPFQFMRQPSVTLPPTANEESSILHSLKDELFFRKILWASDHR